MPQPSVDAQNKITIHSAQDQGSDLSDHHPISAIVSGLKLISYNVQFMHTFLGNKICGHGKSDRAGIKKKTTSIANWLVSQNPDVICLQEIFDDGANKEMENILAAKGYTATNRLNKKTSNSRLNGGIRTFIKTANQQTTVIATHSHVYKKTIDYLLSADALANKGILHTIIQKNGQQYHILNTHSQASREDRRHYVEITLAQCTELFDFVEKQCLAGHIKTNDVVVLGGDFNIAKPLATETSLNADYQKMLHMLGSRYTILPYGVTQNSPAYSYSSENTNNQEKNCTSENLDMFITYTAKKSDDSVDEVDKLFRLIQKGLAKFVKSKATIMNLWSLSVADKIKLEFWNTCFNKLIQTSEALVSQKQNPFENEEWQKNALNLINALPKKYKNQARHSFFSKNSVPYLDRLHERLESLIEMLVKKIIENTHIETDFSPSAEQLDLLNALRTDVSQFLKSNLNEDSFLQKIKADYNITDPAINKYFDEILQQVKQIIIQSKVVPDTQLDKVLISLKREKERLKMKYGTQKQAENRISMIENCITNLTQNKDSLIYAALNDQLKELSHKMHSISFLSTTMRKLFDYEIQSTGSKKIEAIMLNIKP